MANELAPTDYVPCLALEPARTYPLRYAWTLLRHMVHPSALRIDTPGIAVETDFEIPRERFQRWLDAFAGRDVAWRSLLAAKTPPLFSYHSPADTFALFGLIRRLGVPFRTILHASTATRRFARLQPGCHYTSHVTFEGAEPRRGYAALLRFRTRVLDGLGDEVLEAQNALFVKNVPAEQWDRLTKPSTPTRVRRKAARLEAPDWSHTQTVSPDLGRTFGLLSGDLNPLHTSKHLARLAGHPTGFIQGMCAYNLTVAAFRKHGVEPLAGIEMTFSRPFYIGRAATLNVLGDDFEWVDAKGKVLGYGKVSTGPIASPVAPRRRVDRSTTWTMKPTLRRPAVATSPIPVS